MFDLDDNMTRYRTNALIWRGFPDGLSFETVAEFSVGRTKTIDWLPRIAEAGLSGDSRKLELVVVRAIRALRADAPDVAGELGKILSQYSANAGGLRWAAGPPPVDADEGMSLIKSESVESAERPILPHILQQRVDRFVRERRESAALLAEGFLPPGSVLLTGAPGTGKTMLARWIADQLQLPFVALDLATSISSYLGKTGFNLRRTLDYARSHSCVLLLDEFDAIAKRRDDETEVGELKRIVNVLLKELEDWPLQSVLVAATNHPELLDKAIRRRFDLTIELPLPGESERLAILRTAGARFSNEIPEKLLAACAHCLEGTSGSDLHQLMVTIVRQHLASGVSLVRSLGEELESRLANELTGQNIGVLVREIQNAADGSFTVRELADLFKRSASTIQHHLKKETAHV